MQKDEVATEGPGSADARAALVQRLQESKPRHREHGSGLEEWVVWLVKALGAKLVFAIACSFGTVMLVGTFLVSATPHDGPGLPRILGGAVAFFQVIAGVMASLILPPGGVKVVEAVTGLVVAAAGIGAVLLVLGMLLARMGRLWSRVINAVLDLLPSTGRWPIFKLWWESDFWSKEFRSDLKWATGLGLIWVGIARYGDSSPASYYAILVMLGGFWLHSVAGVMYHAGRLVRLLRIPDVEDVLRVMAQTEVCIQPETEAPLHRRQTGKTHAPARARRRFRLPGHS